MHSSKHTWRLAVAFCGLLLTLYPASGQTTPAQTPAETTTTPDTTKLTPAQKQAAAKQAAAEKQAAAKQAAAEKQAAAKEAAAEKQSAAKQGTANRSAANPAAAKPAATTATTTGLPSRQPAATTKSASTSAGVPSRTAGTSTTSPAASTTSTSNTGTSRTALTTQGLGSFEAAGYTMVAYGCYRSANSLLCDFDLSRPQAVQMGVQPFNNLVVVDDGGKINRRRNAYYMGTDGTHMAAAYISSTPVRYIMEFDDVGQQTTSVSLVRGANRIDNVPVKAAAETTSTTAETPVKTPAK